MPNVINQRFMRLFSSACALGAIAAFTASASAIVVRTDHGNGADTELREEEEATRGGARDLNARTDLVDDNEFIVVRFDLTGQNRPAIFDSQLQVIVNRTGTNSPNGFEIYGLNPGVANQNWVEGTANGTWNAANPFPGVTWDGDVVNTAPGLNPGETTFLGALSWTTSPAQGDVLSFSAAALDTFLQNAGDLATFFLIQENVSNAQLRIASKETTALGQTGTVNPPIIDGTFAPRLDFQVPEPAGIGLLSFGALALVRRRR